MPAEPMTLLPDVPATPATPPEPATNPLTGDIWGGLASMLVALPSAIAFGVTLFVPLGGSLAAQGAMLL